MREKILRALNGEKISPPPIFSGLLHLSLEGLANEGLHLSEVHRDAQKMAQAATNAYRQSGIPSATLPLDFCYPAEALGAELIFFDESDPQFPQVRKLLFTSTHEIVNIQPRLGGRIPLICNAIEQVKKEVGGKIVLSALLPGPFTFLIYICKAQRLFREMKDEPQIVRQALDVLARFLIEIGATFRNAGADFVTIHETGGSPGFLGPKPFAEFVQPALQTLTDGLPRPISLAVCGKLDNAMHLLTQIRADAFVVDQSNDLRTARASINEALLFGGVDAVATLYRGDENSVVESVQRSRAAGADGICPSCDLVLQTPLRNLKALANQNF